MLPLRHRWFVFKVFQVAFRLGPWKLHGRIPGLQGGYVEFGGWGGWWWLSQSGLGYTYWETPRDLDVWYCLVVFDVLALKGETSEKARSFGRSGRLVQTACINGYIYKWITGGKKHLLKIEVISPQLYPFIHE